MKERLLCEKIFEVIRERIVRLEYPPGMNLSEKDLCDEFEVSRTPLREAIRKLSDMKLVTVIPRFGTHVSEIDIKEIRSAFEVKVYLEGLSAMLSASRIANDDLDELSALVQSAESIATKGTRQELIKIDDAFHAKIWNSTQNTILFDFLMNIHSRCARLWNSSLGDHIPNSEVASQLKELFCALKERNADKSRKLAQLHVQYFIEKIKNVLI